MMVVDGSIKAARVGRSSSVNHYFAVEIRSLSSRLRYKHLLNELFCKSIFCYALNAA
jgi:hypothetical protein